MSFHLMIKSRTIAVTGLVVAGLMLFAAPAVGAQELDHPCFAPREETDDRHRIEDCTALIEEPDVPSDKLARAYAMRALSYSIIGDFTSAIRDYDKSIDLDPNNAIALNNRAWALFKAGQSKRGLPDVERSLAIDPWSPHALDTRAHIRHTMGETPSAIADYERAMDFGGERIVRLYQCGLQAHGLYKGPLDGIRTSQLSEALKACLGRRGCDPLPPDEECKVSTS